jgi:hypothetical protein
MRSFKLYKAGVISSALFSVGVMRYFFSNRNTCQGGACEYISVTRNSADDVVLKNIHPYWAVMVSVNINQCNQVLKDEIYLNAAASYTVKKKLFDEQGVEVIKAINCPRR